MPKPIPSIHHVTAIAGDPQQNIDFYTGFLGLRLVKLTVNFDDPGTYHLYYGNETGAPGTILTFFPWPGAPRGRNGAGQATSVGFAIQEGSLNFWIDRLKASNITFDASRRFDEQVLAFHDPHQLQLELIATSTGAAPWRNGPVPAEHAVRGIHSVTLSERSCTSTSDFLTDVLRFREAGESGNHHRYLASEGGAGCAVDLVCEPELRRGMVAVGTVHHVAWRSSDDADQLAWRQEIVAHGHDVTAVLDRNYFHSIYFNEPGGVLFEIATDPPGFTVDEPLEELGQRLKLPPWLEPQRARIEGLLSKLRLPKAGGV